MLLEKKTASTESKWRGCKARGPGSNPDFALTSSVTLGKLIPPYFSFLICKWDNYTCSIRLLWLHKLTFVRYLEICLAYIKHFISICLKKKKEPFLIPMNCLFSLSLTSNSSVVTNFYPLSPNIQINIGRLVCSQRLSTSLVWEMKYPLLWTG